MTQSPVSEPNDLSIYGLRPWVTERAAALGAGLSALGRVTSDHKGGCRVITQRGEVLAVAMGRLRSDPERRPTVGDWVLLRDAGAGQDRAIEAVIERQTRLIRRAAGREHIPQVLAANVDVAFLVCALGRDVNARRIERLATMASNGGVRPVLVLTKADLVEDPEPYIERAREAAPSAPIHVVSPVSGMGMEALDSYFAGGATVTLMGTSGAGKSTLVNYWLGGAIQATNSLGMAGKGRHTTTSRQMFVLPNGGIVLDAPGIREVALWAGDKGLQQSFDDIDALASDCRFSNCQHTSEPGCAVRAAVDEGVLENARYLSFLTLGRELAAAERADEEGARRKHKAHAKEMTRALEARLREKGRR